MPTDLAATKATHLLGNILYTATRQGHGMAVFLFASKVTLYKVKAVFTLHFPNSWCLEFTERFMHVPSSQVDG